MTSEFIGFDGRFWFRISGTDRGTGICFDADVFGIDGNNSVLDADGCPLSDGDGIAIAVRRACAVTDKMRAEARA